MIVAGGQQIAAYRLTYVVWRPQVSGLPVISLSTPALGDGMIFLTLTNRVGDLDENIVKLPAFDELLKKYDKNKDGKLSVYESPYDLVLFTHGRSNKVGDWAKVREEVSRFDKDEDKALSRQEWQQMLEAMNKMTSSMQIAVAGIRLEGNTGKYCASPGKKPRAFPSTVAPLLRGTRLPGKRQGHRHLPRRPVWQRNLPRTAWGAVRAPLLRSLVTAKST